MQKFITFAAFLLSSSAALAVPETFLYVGDLDENGAPADGNFSVTFQMFDDEEAGTKVFEETVASLVVVDGALVHELGAGASNPLDDAELAGDLYLSVVVNGTVLEPRVPIRAVPFARSSADASRLAGQPASSFLTSETGSVDGDNIADGTIQSADIGSIAVAKIDGSGNPLLIKRSAGCGGGLSVLNEPCSTIMCGINSSNQPLFFNCAATLCLNVAPTTCPEALFGATQIGRLLNP